MEFSQAEIEEFKLEALDLLEAAEDNLLQLDRGATLATHYDAIFRCFHSIKGGAGMLGLESVQEHMHKVESKFGQLKTQPKLEMTSVSFFLRAVDACRKLFDGEEIDFDYENPTPAPIAKKTSSPSKISASKHDLVVYIVDDEPDICDVLQDIVTSGGLLAKTFTEPEKLVAAVKDQKPDLVLSDFKMPVMTGLDVLKAVHAIDPELPVIFISGMLTKDVLIEAISHNVAGSIEKPFSREMVIAQCKTAARQYRTSKMLNRSINLLLYEYTDLDDFLKTQGKEDIRKSIRKEIQSLLELRRNFR